MADEAKTARTAGSIKQKSPRKLTPEAKKLRAWLDEHPEVAEGIRRGAEDFRAGRYRRLSPSDFKD
jgi:hypothetical protein